MNNTVENSSVADSMYFAPLLPWQQALWSQLTTRVLSQQSLPHALLAAGMQGMGKRAFVWRLVAWLLCRERENHPMGACAACESCQWLRSGTHPSLQVLPIARLPISTDHVNDTDKSSSTAKDKKPTKSTSNSVLKIKVDDIRALQPFIYQGGQGMRICVLDYAEQMTVAAANALLKTLEEPQAQVHLFLISDAPAQLLPTIKSRVQQLALQTIDTTVAMDYVTTALGHIVNREAVGLAAIEQLIQLANGAPLAAIAMAKAPWYSKRALWLTTWQALRSGKRSSVAASDYWQNQLDIAAFIQLSEMMLLDMRRVCLGLSELQNDINLSAILETYQPADNGLALFASSLQQTKTALQQNVQEKFAYDKLMQELAYL
ncbi:DNA polymerase III subunit delta' [Psychrobacter aquaticus]|uniref:DNA-directed DNA polymerase n=1 Tax=Psychrobacter aquaticus CMS 56 TaxID=1354303 RepID=U4T7U9_9GAMM|nr:DNA polymerase III subunit delta' [Psychrobacter aquaticus]ERL54814.1 DNA polymerase III delta prime subunit [Psychrobacter aquaticus CMS 56]